MFLLHAGKSANASHKNPDLIADIPSSLKNQGQVALYTHDTVLQKPFDCELSQAGKTGDTAFAREFADRSFDTVCGAIAFLA